MSQAQFSLADISIFHFFSNMEPELALVLPKLLAQKNKLLLSALRLLPHRNKFDTTTITVCVRGDMS